MHSNHLVLEQPICMASILEPSKANFFHAMTKIVGTLGLKSRSVEVISGCLKARISVAQFDFSWGDTKYHQETLENLKAAVKSSQHEMEHSGEPYSENLAEGYDSMTGEEAVKFWLTEKQYYDYHSNSYVEDECLHFTQVVWRKSVHLGCARIKCHNGWMFVICSYDPPGNIEGQRPY
ncbi:hypothetical protein FNV43_RR17636 [Rhamnella rubrinervis]|uniref:SCP domain-containing protein n=1 Tax=Rhamnella rubrinervis TaxID=2594499 RepID=A0A8K0GV16_9ROSA|nr:hypothetical protein FNV43_RR17636 [Rhamnella rubrinervis]